MLSKDMILASFSLIWRVKVLSALKIPPLVLIFFFFCLCRFFQKYRMADYARSGNVATETVVLGAGPLKFEHSHTIEPQLRQLGLPTALVKGRTYHLNK
jgi:hypothetical protein